MGRLQIGHTERYVTSFEKNGSNGRRGAQPKSSNHSDFYKSWHKYIWSLQGVIYDNEQLNVHSHRLVFDKIELGSRGLPFALRAHELL